MLQLRQHGYDKTSCKVWAIFHFPLLFDELTEIGYLGVFCQTAREPLILGENEL